MTIEIQTPELEQRILQLMEGGEFSSVEDLLKQALSSSTLETERTSDQGDESLGDFLRSSPLWGSGLEIPPRTEEPRVPEL